MVISTIPRVRIPRHNYIHVVTGLILLFVTAICFVLWWFAVTQTVWIRTRGRIVSCSIEKVHYNAEPYRHKVSLTYEYFVGPNHYRGHFKGMWPQLDSPNSLPENRIEELQRPGFPLVVLYERDNPGHSVLHPQERHHAVLFCGLSLAGFLLSVFYWFRVFPRLT